MLGFPFLRDNPHRGRISCVAWRSGAAMGPECWRRQCGRRGQHRLLDWAPAFRRLVRVAPQRFESMRGFVIRHGPFGVFVARFIAWLRFLAGPLAGAIGLRFIPFTTANVLGALVFVPVAVGVGYAGGYGVGAHVEWILRMTGKAEYLIVTVALILVGAILVRRVLSAFHN